MEGEEKLGWKADPSSIWHALNQPIKERNDNLLEACIVMSFFPLNVQADFTGTFISAKLNKIAEILKCAEILGSIHSITIFIHLKWND